MAVYVKDMYNFVTSEMGFAPYSDAIAGTTSVRYVLSKLNQGFEKVISDLVTRTGSLQRVRQYTTVSGEAKYLIDGIIQSVKLGNSKLHLGTSEPITSTGKPSSYYISNDGALMLSPVPDGEYALIVQTSTKNIVLSDNDTPRNHISDINDEILITFEMSQAICYAAIVIMMSEFNLKSEGASAVYESLLDYATELELKTNETPRNIRDFTSNYNLLEF